jgi:hypothetical protein
VSRPDTQPATCRCGQPVLAAAAEGVLAVRTDPHALTPAGEIAALYDRRVIFGAYQTPKGVHLAFRYAHHIRHDIPRPVLAEHRCGRPVTLIDPDRTRELETWLNPARGRKETGPCPF